MRPGRSDKHQVERQTAERQTQTEYHQLIVAFNRKLEGIASRHEASVFDVYTTTRGQLALHLEFFSDDGFHPSDKGREFWADEMWPIIALTIGGG